MDETNITPNRGGRTRTLLAIVAVLAVLCALLPYIAAQRYALFYSDDFSIWEMCSSFTGSTLVVRALSAAAAFWRGWQGTYFSFFLLALLNPLNVYSFGLLRAELIALTLGTVSAAFWLGSLLCGYFGIERKNSAFLCALVITPLLLYREYTEVYLWFSGAMTYLAPTLFMLLTLAFLLMGKKGKKLWYAFAAMTVFMMAGGVLECVGLGMFLLLQLCVMERLREGRANKGFCTVFVVGLAGALLNAIAPGNFVRYGGHGDTGSIPSVAMRTLFNSGRAVWEELGLIFDITGFAFFLALAILLGITLKRTVDKRCLSVALVGLILTPAVTIFPVVLGYNWAGGGFPTRAQLLFDASIYFSLVMIAVLLGSQLSALRLPKAGKVIRAAVVAAIAVSPLLWGTLPKQHTPVEITENLLDGSIREFSTEWRVVYDYLHECGYEDVLVRRAMPERRTGCALVKLDALPDSWTNVDIAKYFGLKSVCLNPPVPDEVIAAIE